MTGCSSTGSDSHNGIIIPYVLNTDQIMVLEKIRAYRNAILQRTDRYVAPGRQLSNEDYTALNNWRQALRDLPARLRPSDLRRDDSIYEIDVSVFPKAPGIICLNVLSKIYPFITDFNASPYY